MSRPVVTLTTDETIEAAVATLGKHGFNGAPVVDDDGHLVGLLDDSDLLLSDVRLHAPTTVQILGAYLTLPGEQQRFEEDLRRALAQTVGEVMKSDPPALTPDATVEDAATIMVDRAVSRVPILEGRKVIGIVTRGDLIRAMYRR